MRFRCVFWIDLIWFSLVVFDDEFFSTVESKCMRAKIPTPRPQHFYLWCEYYMVHPCGSLNWPIRDTSSPNMLTTVFPSHPPVCLTHTHAFTTCGTQGVIFWHLVKLSRTCLNNFLLVKWSMSPSDVICSAPVQSFSSNSVHISHKRL